MNNYSFTHEILYKDWPITLEVEFEFYQGSTPAMGDDSSEVGLVSAIDGTGSDVLKKLSGDVIELLEHEAWNHIW